MQTWEQKGTDRSLAFASSGQMSHPFDSASENCLNFSRSPGGKRRRAEVWPSLFSLCCVLCTISATFKHRFSKTRWHSALQHAKTWSRRHLYTEWHWANSSSATIALQPGHSTFITSVGRENKAARRLRH